MTDSESRTHRVWNWFSLEAQVLLTLFAVICIAAGNLLRDWVRNALR